MFVGINPEAFGGTIDTFSRTILTGNSPPETTREALRTTNMVSH
jgi:hypothetical protein